jgi:hypothetical protein
MIEKSPTIKISGKNYDFYSVDFENNGSDGPSSLSVNYVNTSGDLAHIPLGNYKTSPTEIKIFKTGASEPSFRFKGYAVSSKISERPGQNTLSVKYYDESSILDNKIIGLKSKFGEGFKVIKEKHAFGSFSEVILVGREVNECLDIPLAANRKDRCSPCKKDNGTVNQQIIDCENQSDYIIRDVVYSFSDLITAIQTSGIKIQSPPNSTNNNYFARYTGTIREVLNNWCSDYGITFYWDYEDGIKFVDLKKGITINDSSISNLSCRILGKEDENSIESNKSNSLIAYFGAEGEALNYDCNTSSLKAVSLKPLILRDLVTGKTGEVDPKIIESYKTVENFYNCCCLANYSTTLRDLYVLYYIYEIRTAAEMEAALLSKMKMNLLGNLKPIKIMSKEDTDESDKSGYFLFLHQLGKDKAKDLVDRKMYFVSAERSKVLYDRYLEVESNLGKNFLGQYWYRFYSTINRTVSPQISAPDGSAQYYKSGDEMSFDFLSILPSSIINLAEFIKTDKKAAASNSVAADNFIMMKRGAAWSPAPGSSEVDKMVEDLSRYAIQDYGDEVFLDSSTKDSRLYSFFEMPSGMSITVTSDYPDNTIDKEKKNIVYKKDSMILTYGLKSAACKGIRVKTEKNLLSIYTPTQSFDSTTRGTGESGAAMDFRVRTHGGYKVFVESPVNFSTTVYKKKVEYIYGGSALGKNCTGVNVNYRNVTQDIIKIIKDSGLRTEKGTTYCDYDGDAIKVLIKNFAEKLGISEPIVKRNLKYVIGGFFPTELTLKDGLMSFNIRYDGQDGFTTHLNFSNIPKIRVNESITIKEFEKYLKAQNFNHQLSFNKKDVAPSEVL